MHKSMHTQILLTNIVYILLYALLHKQDTHPKITKMLLLYQTIPKFTPTLFGNWLENMPIKSNKNNFKITKYSF